MQAGEIDYSRKWYVLAAVGMGTFLATIDSSIVNIALPTLEKQLSTSFALVQWVVLAYLLTATTLMLSVGRLADILGKKNIYLYGFIVFTLGSLLCGLSTSIGMLIAFRVLQALGAVMVVALGTAILTEAFPSSELGRVMGISGTIVSIGIVIGPTLGGLILQYLSWHWIFFVNLPVGILGIYLVLRFIPNIRPTGKQRFDYLGAFSLFCGLLAFLLALTIGQETGFLNITVAVLFILAVLGTVAFLFIERHTIEPMIDLRLFRDLFFSASLFAAFITFFAIGGALILMPFYLQNVLGYDTSQAGLLLAVLPLGLGIASPLSGVLSDRFGTRSITIIGLGLLSMGYAFMRGLGVDTSAVGYAIRYLFIGLGMGIFQSPNLSAVMGAAPRRQLGIVSGMYSMSRSLGQVTGIAVLSSIWAATVIRNSVVTQQGEATSAPLPAQVAGLQAAFTVLVIFMLGALTLTAWAWWRERQQAQAEVVS